MPRICHILENLNYLRKKGVFKGDEKAATTSLLDNDEDEKAYQHLGLLTFVCISKFGGYPQLYKPALDIILVI